MPAPSHSKGCDKGSRDVPAWQGSPAPHGGMLPSKVWDHGCALLPPLPPSWPEGSRKVLPDLGVHQTVRVKGSEPPWPFGTMLVAITSQNPSDSSSSPALLLLLFEKLVKGLKGLRASIDLQQPGQSNSKSKDHSSLLVSA